MIKKINPAKRVKIILEQDEILVSYNCLSGLYRWIWVFINAEKC
jgi:hypothetical protein